MLKYVPIVMLAATIIVLYSLLVIYQYVDRTVLNVLGLSLIVSSVWINVIGLKRIGITSIERLKFKRINFVALAGNSFLSYLIFNHLAPGRFEEFTFYYLSLGLSLTFYILTSVEFVKNEE